MHRAHALALPLALTLLCAGCPGGGSVAAPTPTVQPPLEGVDPPAGVSAPPPAAPFDRATAKTPWKYAQVGDWATYSIAAGSKTLTMKFVVTEVSDTEVKFTVSDAKTGELRSTETVVLAEAEEDYTDPFTYDALDGEPQTKTIDFKGRELEVLIVKRKREGMGSTELWLAEKDVRPFNQCAVKSIKDGQLKLELLDFGTK